MQMSPYTYRLAKALNQGRAGQARPQSREQVLVRLLMKRAAAYRAGLTDLEQALRRQIAWSLPMYRGEDDASLQAHAAPVVNDRL